MKIQANIHCFDAMADRLVTDERQHRDSMETDQRQLETY